MEGDRWDIHIEALPSTILLSSHPRSVPELKGIIPNSFAHIFGHIAKSGEDKNFLVRVSHIIT
jgi:hypothetical protein